MRIILSIGRMAVRTTMGNLVTLCTFHHQLLHEGGWQVRVVDGAEGDGFAFSDRLGRVREALPGRSVVDGDLRESVGVLPTDGDASLTIGWDGRAVDYDHVIHVFDGLRRVSRERATSELRELP